VGRLLPQSFYYVHAMTQLPPDAKPTVFSVPCGNFGNLTAGLMAKRMGLPVHHFCAATNVNDVVPRYLKTGTYDCAPSKRTISNAMDVGAPSNFERMTHLYQNRHADLARDVSGWSFSDEQTVAEIGCAYHKHGYTLDPHTAVGRLGWNAEQAAQSASAGIVLATAHPAKFPDVVEAETAQAVPVPDRLGRWFDRQECVERLSPDYSVLRDYLIDSK
jgi:threonine synthase